MKDDLQSWGITLLRLAIGGIFVAHGSQKLFIYGRSGVTGAMAHMGIPFPAISAVLATLTEFVGGIALLLGLFTRLAALPVAFAMFVALAKVHFKGGFFLPMGYEYVLTLMLANIALALTGPGAFALDNLLAKRAPQRARRQFASAEAA